MKTLLLFIFCPFLLISQEQVSNVYYDEILDPVYFNGNAGFTEIDERNYFLLDRDSLMIFEIENDELTLVHTITERPSIDYKLPLIHNQHTSNLAIVEDKYFRFYRDVIQVIDIPSGSIISELDLNPTDYSLYVPIKIYGDHIFFRGFGIDSERLVLRYNWQTQDLDALPSFFEAYGFNKLIDERFYFNVPDDKMIMSINGITEESDTVYNYTSTLDLFQAHTNLGSEYIMIKDETGIYIIDANFELRSLECIGDFEGDLKTINLRNEKLFVSEWDAISSLDKLAIIDINTCDTLQYFELEGGTPQNKLTFYDNQVKDFTIFSHKGNIYGVNGFIYLIDHNLGTLSNTTLGLNPATSSMLVNDNALYFLSYITGDLAPSWINLVKYDIASQNFKHLLPYETLSNSTVLGFINDEDELFTIANTLDYDPKIWKVDEDEVFTSIAEMDYRRNHGVGYRSKVITDNDKVISVGIGGLMITDQSTNHFHAEQIYSDLMVTEQGLGAIFERNDSMFVVSSDKDGENVEIDYLTNSHVDYKSLSEGGYLFKYNTQKSYLYYDLDERVEKHLVFENEILNVKRAAAGEDYTLINGYLGTNWGNYEYYLFNYQDQSVVRLDEAIDCNLYYTSGDNTFYLVDTDYASDQTKIQRYHPLQGFEIIYDGEGIRHGFNTVVEKSSDDAVTIEIKLDNKVRVLRDNGTMTFTHDFDHNTSNFNSFVKGRNENSIILNASLDNIRETYYLKFGNNPVLIETGINSNLVAAHIDGNLALLFYWNEFGTGYKVYIYDSSSNTVSESIELGNGYGINTSRISTVESEKSYIYSYGGEEVGYEPWILDIESKSVELLANLAVRNDSSSPRNFVNASGFVYFTAKINDQSRQWFRVESDLINGVKQNILKSLTPINIFPNPTTDHIAISDDYKSLKIYHSNGHLVKSIKNYKSGDNISTLEFSTAIYFIQAQSQNGVYSTASFTKTN